MCALEPGMVFDHRILPSSALTHTRERSSALAACTKTLLPQMMGEELPSPGMAVFQRTPSFAVHCTGMVLSAATPEPSAPWKRGQSAATAARANARNSPMVARRVNMIPSGGPDAPFAGKAPRYEYGWQRLAGPRAGAIIAQRGRGSICKAERGTQCWMGMTLRLAQLHTVSALPLSLAPSPSRNGTAFSAHCFASG